MIKFNEIVVTKWCILVTEPLKMILWFVNVAKLVTKSVASKTPLVSRSKNMLSIWIGKK